MKNSLFILFLSIIFFSSTKIEPTLEEQKKPKICLNMIVKNESHVISRSLGSVKGLIDYWVIVDTGSTDGTQEIIKTCLKGIPGELYERPWKDFGYNRTEALNLAKNKGEYLLFLDADDWLEYDTQFKWASLTKDVYKVWWSTPMANHFSYLKPLLVKNCLPWIWEGVMHEYLTCVSNDKQSEEVLDGLHYIIGGNGARSKDPQKFQKAAAVLEEALKKEPNNSRYVFYLAESYRDANEIEKALTAHQKRVGMGGWDEEVFWSLFQTAQLKNSLKHPLEDVIESYHRAHRFRPHRAEPIYYLSQVYNQNHQYLLAYECIKGWEAIPKLKEKDVLFNMDWVEEYGLKFELSICSYYLNNCLESLALSNQLLEMKSLPDHLRKQVEVNREFPLTKLSHRDR